MIGSMFLAAVVVVTSPVLLGAVIAGALAAGYGIGRGRPWQRLGDWAEWQLRLHADRWATVPRQIALVALLLLTDPAHLIRAWRHRQDA